MLGDRWGVTAEEVARRYPCDDVVIGPAIPLWRGVTVRAPVERVWPWVRQLRLAPYSYDWVDNGGRRSPQRLVDLPEPVPGDPFSRVAGKLDVGRVLSVDPGRQLTVRIAGAVVSYVLVPQGSRTRLLMKVVVPRRWWAAPVALGDWPMARRQLLVLKQRAEG